MLKGFWWSMFLILATLNVVAAEQDAATNNEVNQAQTVTVVKKSAIAQKTPLQWLEQMSHAYTDHNFQLSIIHLQRNRIQSFSFEHGVVDNKQVVYIGSLTGAVSHSYRIDDHVTYIDPDTQPYTVKADIIAMPSPSFFINKQQVITDNYTLSLAGKGRVAGRVVQLVRLKSKDQHRFNYVLWLDSQSSLLLRYDSYDLNNNLVEQMQVIKVEVAKQPTKGLTSLVNTKPLPLTILPSENLNSRWQFNWLPQGYQVTATDSHRLTKTAQSVDYLMLSDGLTEISVYVALAGEISFPERIITEGGIAVARHRQSNIDITVVGKAPLETVTKIAHSITLKQQ